MSSTTTTNLLSTFSNLTASSLAGANFAVSAFLAPSLLHYQPPHLHTHWRTLYTSVKRSLPAIGGLAGLGYFYLAYDAYASSTKPSVSAGAETAQWRWISYAVCGLLSFGVGPYTGLVMGRVERELLAGGGGSGEVVRWGRLNAGKGALLGAAAVLGAWTGRR